MFVPEGQNKAGYGVVENDKPGDTGRSRDDEIKKVQLNITTLLISDWYIAKVWTRRSVDASPVDNCEPEETVAREVG